MRKCGVGKWQFHACKCIDYTRRHKLKSTKKYDIFFNVIMVMFRPLQKRGHAKPHLNAIYFMGVFLWSHYVLHQHTSQQINVDWWCYEELQVFRKVHEARWHYFIVLSSLLLVSSPTRKIFYPQPPSYSAQTVVTGVFLSPRRCLPSFFSPIVFSFLPRLSSCAPRFSSSCAINNSSRSRRAFRLSMVGKLKTPSVSSGRIQPSCCCGFSPFLSQRSIDLGSRA